MRKIVTSYVNPPIPVRKFDWCAHFDGEEEAGGYGYGPTEAEAIRDFLDNLDEGIDLPQPRVSPGFKETLDQLYELGGERRPSIMSKLFLQGDKK